MAITHALATRNALANQIDDQTNSGTTETAGAVVYMTAGEVEVATMRMSNPAFGAASSGSITANTINNDNSATGGVVSMFKVVDRDDNEVYRGTVGLDGSGSDIEFDPAQLTTTIDPGAVVAIDSLVYVAPV